MLRPDPIQSAHNYAIYTKNRIIAQEYERSSEAWALARVTEIKKTENLRFNTDGALEFADDICWKLPKYSKFELVFTRVSTGLRCVIGYDDDVVCGPSTNIFATIDIIRKRYHYYKCRVFIAFDDQLAADFEFCDPYECAMMMAPILCRDLLSLVVRNLV